MKETDIMNSSDVSGNSKLIPIIFNSLPLGIFICDAEGKILEANSVCIQILQLPFNYQEIKNNLCDFLFIEDRQIIHENIKKINDTKTSGSFVQFIGYNNVTFTGELKLSSLPGEIGIHSGFLATVEKFSEEKLKLFGIDNSIEKFWLLAENIKDIVWSMDSNMNFTYISPSNKELRGFEHDDTLGQSVFDIMTPESKKNLLLFIEERQNKIKNGEKPGSITYEAELFNKAGQTYWAEIISNPILDNNGLITGYNGITRNIQERKEIELALSEIDQRYRIVVQNAPIVLFQIDSDGIFRLSEGGALNKLGLKPGQVVGMSVYDVYKDSPDICKQVRKSLAGETVQEIIHVHEIVFETFYHPIFGRKGKIKSTIGIAIEISDKYKTEVLLRENEIKFRTLFESMAEGVALHNLVFNETNNPVDYRIIDVNKAYEKHTGLKQENVKNKLASEIYKTGYPPFLNEYSNVAIHGIPFHFETYFQPLGKHFRISVVCTGENKFATVFEDISDQKNREKELKSKNEELERFTYTVSHDLRSPLVTIKGFIGLLEEDLAENNTERIQDDIKRIGAAADKMTDLLNDLLELSRIGRIINPPVEISMLLIVNNTLELLSGILCDKNAKVTVDQNLPKVFVDKQRIGEVWQNLIENALKFTENHIPELEIGYLNENGFNIFFLKDNGKGIDPKYHETIFGLFNKLDPRISGTGIGLSLVRSIIEVHGGKIWVESEGFNKGSTFKFSIPDKI